MRCGNCKSNHDTTLEVRLCYKNAGRFDGGGLATPTATTQETVWPPSDKQVAYVLGLQEERNLPEGYVVRPDYILKAMDRDKVSDLIVFLRDLSRKEGKAGNDWSMPEGRYALQDDNKVWRFYEVNKPDQGRWKGYTFIKLLVGSPGQYQKMDIAPDRRNALLRIIDANSKQAMLDYGFQSGVCGRCSSPLTDPESLARGIGPVCAKRSGWS